MGLIHGCKNVFQKLFEENHLMEVLNLYLKNIPWRGDAEMGRPRHFTVDTPSWVYVLGSQKTPILVMAKYQ